MNRAKKKKTSPFKPIFIFLVMAASWLYMISLATPGVEAVRIRNALLHQTGTLKDFSWRPDEIPSDFKTETTDPIADFKKFVTNLNITPEMSPSDKMLTVSKSLLSGGRFGSAIQSNSVDVLNLILSEGMGYCADYTQVMNGIAHTMGIPIREWGISFDGYGGDGHAFTEFYDTLFKKWIFIDVFYGFYIADNNGIPLSVLEFRELLAKNPDKLVLNRILPEQFAFKNHAAALEYYKKGMPQLFLIWANDVFSYDANPVIGFSGNFSRALEQFTGIVLGIQPELRLYPDPATKKQRNTLLFLKYKIYFLIVLNIVLGILFLFSSFTLFTPPNLNQDKYDP